MQDRNVEFHQNEDNKKECFLYIQGMRENKVVLVAHADTVWDEAYDNGNAYT